MPVEIGSPIINIQLSLLLTIIFIRLTQDYMMLISIGYNILYLISENRSWQWRKAWPDPNLSAKWSPSSRNSKTRKPELPSSCSCTLVPFAPICSRFRHRLLHLPSLLQHKKQSHVRIGQNKEIGKPAHSYYGARFLFFDFCVRELGGIVLADHLHQP